MVYGAIADHEWQPPYIIHSADWNEAETMLLGGKIHHSIDIAKLCGGEGRSSQIAGARRLKVGPNFDLVVGIELKDPATQRKVLIYLNDNRCS